MSEELPRQFGRYTLIRRIAAGGMAELFLARRTGPAGTEKEVAIKRILPGLATDDGFIAMFLNEARLAALLSHASVVRTYDLGRAEDTLYIAMEYVDGVNLREVGRMLRRMKRNVPFAIAAVLGARVAEALDYAHRLTAPGGASLGLVHRDVSPDNMLLTRDGYVKLADFGIAKAFAARQMTRTHGLKGKANYISPEQILEGPLDGRADLFSLGASLYLLTTQRFPFAASSDLAILHQIIHTEPIPPTRLVPGYPVQLERIVLRLLAKQPSARYADGGEAAAALFEFARDAGATLTQRELADFLAHTEEEDRVFRAAHPEVSLTAEVPIPPVAQVHEGPLPLPTATTLPDLQPTRAERASEQPTIIAEVPAPKPRQPRVEPTVVAAAPPAKPAPPARAAEREGLEKSGEREEGAEPEDIPTDKPVPAPAARAGRRETRESKIVTDAVPELAVTARRPSAWALAALAAAAVVVVMVVGMLVRPAPDANGRPPKPPRAGGELPLGAVELVGPGARDGSGELEPPAHVEPPAGVGTGPVGAPAQAPPRELVDAGRAVAVVLPRTSPGAGGGGEPRATPPEAPRMVDVRLDSAPHAEVSLGKTKVGNTPVSAKLPAGRVTLVFENAAEGLHSRVTLDVEGPSMTKTVNFRKGRLAVDWPEGTGVYVDGRRIGKTPLEPIELYEGDHLLEVIHPTTGARGAFFVEVKAEQTVTRRFAK